MGNRFVVASTTERYLKSLDGMSGCPLENSSVLVLKFFPQ